MTLSTGYEGIEFFWHFIEFIHFFDAIIIMSAT